MVGAKIPRNQADIDAQWLCDEIDAKCKKWDKLHNRFPILCILAFFALGGIADVLHGRDGAVLREFGEFGVNVPFIALPVLAIWAFLDWSGMKEVSCAIAEARSRLKKRGYEYWGNSDGSLYRLPSDSV